MPGEQRQADLHLERGDVLRDRRLGQAEAPGCIAQRAVAIDLDETAKEKK